MKGFEFKGSTKEDAIEKGLKKLNLTAEEVEVEVLSLGGFLSKVCVRLTPKDVVAAEEVLGENVQSFAEDAETDKHKLSLAGETAVTFTKALVDMMRINCGVSYNLDNDEINISIDGQDANIVIGYRGECLDALQFFVSTIVNQGNKDLFRVQLDAGNYRQKRKEMIISIAQKNARHAYKTGKRVALDPMNPAERRIVHTALAEDTKVSTHSEGEGRARRVIIIPSNMGQVSASSSAPSSSGDAYTYGTSDFRTKGPARTKSFGYNKKKF